MKNSLKQLIRTPMKALLFFLLLTAGTALLTVGVCLFVQTSERIAKVENEFTTIATVEQKPVSTYIEESYNSCLGAYGNELPVYEKLIPFDILDFPGANYIGEPENRPVYLTYCEGVPGFRSYNNNREQYVISFTPLEDGIGSEPISAEVLKVHYTDVVFQMENAHVPHDIHAGDKVSICQHFSQTPVELKKGKVYLASLIWRNCGNHADLFFDGELVVYQQPYSTQYNKDGLPLIGDTVPFLENLYQEGDVTVLHAGADRNFPPFSDPSIGLTEIEYDLENPDGPELPESSSWQDWADSIRLQCRLTPVIPTNDLELLPSFHSGKAEIVQGRAITEEEFETGAKVCLVPKEIIKSFAGGVGSEISLPLYCSLYNYDPGREVEAVAYRATTFQRRYSLLDAKGSLYSPFSNETYTIVGTYAIEARYQAAGETELLLDSIVIPAKAVTASDENNIVYYAPMNAKSTSFRIPNGTIEEFDQKLHEAVPEAAALAITYDDNGYTQVMGNLNRSKSTALLLLFAGAGATVSVIVLLLYFFVVKQKKRTAVERSLGMTRHQCRISLLSGLLILVLLAVCAGTALGSGAVTYASSTEVEGSTYFTTFSDWRDVSVEAEETDIPPLLLISVPTAVWFFTICLSLLLLNRSLRIDPIYLLSGKIE